MGRLIGLMLVVIGVLVRARAQRTTASRHARDVPRALLMPPAEGLKPRFRIVATICHPPRCDTCATDRLSRGYRRGHSIRIPNDMDEFLARPKRFELLTPRFVVWCSIQLSYGRASGHVFNGPAIRSQGPAANVCSSLTTEFGKSKPIRQKFCRGCVIR